MQNYKHSTIRKYALREVNYHNYKHAIYGIRYLRNNKVVLQFVATADNIEYFETNEEYEMFVKRLSAADIDVLAVQINTRIAQAVSARAL